MFVYRVARLLRKAHGWLQPKRTPSGVEPNPHSRMINSHGRDSIFRGNVLANCCSVGASDHSSWLPIDGCSLSAGHRALCCLCGFVNVIVPEKDIVRLLEQLC